MVALKLRQLDAVLRAHRAARDLDLAVVDVSRSELHQRTDLLGAADAATLEVARRLADSDPGGWQPRLAQYYCELGEAQLERGDGGAADAAAAAALAQDPAFTAATQWLERTLDDSANRRMSIPDAYLALDGALVLVENVSRGLIVNPAVVAKNLEEHLPFMATETILMHAVRRGGDRGPPRAAAERRKLGARRLCHRAGGSAAAGEAGG